MMCVGFVSKCYAAGELLRGFSLYIPQVLCSSEPSTQSLSPSHTNPKEMHSPLVTHLNSCEVHDGDAATNKTIEEFTYK